jgi:predicted aspartyl protease
VKNTGARHEATGKSIKSFAFLLPTAYCLLPVFLAFSQEYYRWVDDGGAVHFTDNVYSIPEKYRGQVEKRMQLPSREPDAPAPEQPVAESPRRFVVPFTRSGGNHILVEGIVNGVAAMKFVLDTGAASTMIPPFFATQAGIDLSSGLIVTIGGVAGAADVPLVEVNSINVGGAEVRNLEVLVQDLPLGMGAVGLLGADFLLEYRLDIQYAKDQVVLEPQEGPYGGHSFEWWQKRFRRYANHKRELEAGRSKAANDPARDLLDRQLGILEDKISDLESRASQAGIPQEFRR